MKILILSEYFPESEKEDISGGIEARAFNIAKRLAKKNKVTVITSWKNGLKRQEILSGINVLRVGPHHKYSNEAGFISRIRFAKAAAIEGIKLDIDIVDGYNYTTYLPALIIARKLKKPCIATYHECWIGSWIKNKGIITGVPYEFYERILLALKYDRFISVSQFTKDKLLQCKIRKPIYVIPNGVDTNALKKIKSKKKPLSICFAGRLVKTKNIDILIRATKIIKKTIPEIKCYIIGKGKEMSKLKQLAVDFDVKDNIIFLGFVDKSSDVMKIIKSSTIFCHPSSVEGFGMVLIEAIALNVPYVASDIPPFLEVTDKGVGGLIFKTGDYIDLSAKLLKLFNDKELYNQKKEEEKTLAKKYDWDNITKNIEEIYKGLIE